MTPDARTLARGLALYQQARDLRQRGQIAPAADKFRQALALVPGHPGILADYAQLAEDVKDWNAAVQLYRHLLKRGGFDNVDGRLGLALRNLGQHGEAVPLLAAYTQRNPRAADVLRLLADSLFQSRRYDEALTAAQQAWQAEPHVDAMSLQLAALVELGIAEPTGDLVDEALARFPRDRQVRRLAAEHLLKAGEFARGFALFAAMCYRSDHRRHALEDVPIPAWDGGRFDGTLLVGDEQGVGDAILLSSVFGDIAALGQRTVIETDGRLLPVFRRSFPKLEFVERTRGVLPVLAGERAGCRKAIGGDLFGPLRKQRGDFPARRAWLLPDAERCRAFRERYEACRPDRPRVGISWRSRRELRSGARKDIGLPAWRRLLARDDTAFISLQYGNIAGDLATLGDDAARLQVDDAVDTFYDLDALFAQVAALDLVITTSNVTAHVAGATGTPCWLLLPHRRPVIWYWGYAGETTDWYPSVRIFRNGNDDDWSDLFAVLATSLDEFVATRGPTPIG